MEDGVAKPDTGGYLTLAIQNPNMEPLSQERAVMGTLQHAKW